MMIKRPPALLEFALYGADLDALERFYTALFGFELLLRMPGRMVALRCGHSALLLFDPATTRGGGGVPPHGTTGAGHVAFVVEGDAMGDWRERLAAHDVVIEDEVAWPEGGTSIYFRDPAGNSVELAPPDIWRGLGRSLLRSLADTNRRDTPDG